MAIAFTNSAFKDAAPVKSRPSFFAGLFGTMISARERQAKRYVNGYLLSLDEQTLTELGYDRATIESEGAARFPF